MQTLAFACPLVSSKSHDQAVGKQYLMHDKSRKNCLLFLLLLFREQLCWPNNGCYSGGLVKRKKVLKICRIFSGGGRIKVFNIRSNFSLKMSSFQAG